METASNEEENKKRKSEDNEAPAAPMVVPLTKSQRRSRNKRRQKEEQQQKEEEEERMKATTNQQVGVDEVKKRAAARVPIMDAKRLARIQRRSEAKKKQREEQLQREEEARRKAIQEFENQCSGLKNNTLTELDQDFTEDQATAIGLALIGNISLEKLSLYFQDDKRLTFPGVQALCDGIQQSQLKELWMHGNIIDANFRQCMYQTLEASSSITILAVSSFFHCNPLNPDNILSLAQALTKNSSIRELSFCVDWHLTEEGAQALSLGLQHTQLQKLEVMCGSNGRTCFNWDEQPPGIAFYTLFQTIQHKMQSLEDLTISEFEHWIPFKCIADGLQNTTSLNELVIKNGYLDIDAIRLLSQGLRQNNSVTILRLVGDSIKDDGLIELASHLSHDSCLQELHLDAETDRPMNKFGPRGVESLIRAVANMPAMQKLNLSCSDYIGYPGWKIIGDALPNLTLRELDLRFDPQVEDEDDDYGDEGTDWHESARQALLQGMRENEHVWKLLVHDGAYYQHELFDEMYYYTDRNLWGKRLLTVDHGLPSTIWCYILERCQEGNPNESYHDSENGPSLVYYILREQPTLVQASC